MRAPKAARRLYAVAGLKVVGIVERPAAGEEDGGTGRVEEGSGDWKGWYVDSLEMGIGVAIDLYDRRETRELLLDKYNLH